MSNVELVVGEIADEMLQRPDRGEVATHIPDVKALAKVSAAA